MKAGKVLSIDIGSRNMHIVEGRSHGNTVELDQCVLAPTPEGSVKDGVIEDRASLSIALRAALKENRITTDRVLISLKSTNVITREITVPVVKNEEITPIVLLDMEQYVPNIASDYITGFTLLEKVDGAGGQQLRLRVSAVPKHIILSYSTLLKECNLKPLVMDSHANGMAKLITRNNAILDQTSGSNIWQTAAYIDLGYESTEVNVISKGNLVFSRLLQFGSRQMDANLIAAMPGGGLTLDQKKEKFCDLLQTGTSSDEATTMNGIVRSHMNRWLNEIQTILQFYSGRVAENWPEAFFLYGGSTRLNGLSDYWKRSLSLPVYILKELPIIKMTRKNMVADVGMFLNAVGAICRND